MRFALCQLTIRHQHIVGESEQLTAHTLINLCLVWLNRQKQLGRRNNLHRLRFTALSAAGQDRRWRAQSWLRRPHSKRTRVRTRRRSLCSGGASPNGTPRHADDTAATATLTSAQPARQTAAETMCAQLKAEPSRADSSRLRAYSSISRRYYFVKNDDTSGAKHTSEPTNQHSRA